MIIDTMPFEDSYKKEHIQGAKNFAFVKEAKSGDDWSQIVEGSGTPEQLLALLGTTRPARWCSTAASSVWSQPQWGCLGGHPGLSAGLSGAGRHLRLERGGLPSHRRVGRIRSETTKPAHAGFVVSGAATQERASVTTRLSMRRALPRYAAIRITSCSLWSVAASRVAASTMSMASVRKPALSRRWLAWATREGR